MKVLKRTAPSTVLFLSLFLLTSCDGGVSDTTAKFSEAEKNVTTTDGNTLYVLKGGEVSVSPATVRAESWNVFTVTIQSFAKIDDEVASDALDFYQLEDNWVNLSYYPQRKCALPKILLDKSESSSIVSGEVMITTVLKYQVDCTSVTEQRLAFYADAAKLKDKAGSAILNYRKNEKAGEEDDSRVCYISVTGYTTLLHNIEEESIREVYGSWPGAPEELYTASGIPTGKLRFSCAAPLKTNPYLEPVEYSSEWAETLNSTFFLQVMAAGSSSWETLSPGEFTFVFHDEDDLSNPNAPIYADTITADTPELPAGTRWRVLLKVNPDVKPPKWYQTLFGHRGYVFVDAKARFVLADDYWDTRDYNGESYFFKDSPSYIVSPVRIAPSGAVDFLPQNILLHNSSGPDIYKAQNNLLYVTRKYVKDENLYSAFEWVIGPVKELSSAEDFIVVTSEQILLDSTVSVETDEEGKITEITVSLDNQFFTTAEDDIPVLLAGHGTKLTKNVEYPSQLEFGIYKDGLRPSYMNGYMELYPDSDEEKEEAE